MSSSTGETDTITQVEGNIPFEDSVVANTKSLTLIEAQLDYEDSVHIQETKTLTQVEAKIHN